jgi:hypothetical protein
MKQNFEFCVFVILWINKIIQFLFFWKHARIKTHKSASRRSVCIRIRHSIVQKSGLFIKYANFEQKKKKLVCRHAENYWIFIGRIWKKKCIFSRIYYFSTLKTKKAEKKSLEESSKSKVSLDLLCSEFICWPATILVTLYFWFLIMLFRLSYVCSIELFYLITFIQNTLCWDFTNHF